MQKIIPFLWFNEQAEEAANFYVSLFNHSSIGFVSRYAENSPGKKGSVMTMSFKINNQDFNVLNGGPYFSLNPSISLFVECETENEIDELWKKLSAKGSILMEFSEYPFSKKFGWVQDEFGVSWQLSLTGGKQKIIPFFMFCGAQYGKAEEAMDFYTSLFQESKCIEIVRYTNDEDGKEGTVKLEKFMIEGQEFMAIDSSFNHPFTFNEAFSLFVNCESQEEIDQLWDKLTSDGGAPGRCGWLKDKFGVSWQIVPTALAKLLHANEGKKSKNVMQALMQMNKLDIQLLEQASENE